MKLSRIAAAAAIVGLAAATTAGAADPKPAPGCYGKLFTDKAGDAVRDHPAFAGDKGQDNLDLLDGWLAYDAAKKETSVNIHVKNLDKTVPQGSTSIQWQFEWTGKSGALTWVRAVTDFSGVVTYDFGGQQPTAATTFNVRQGGTTGGFFEGPDGVVQIVIPEALEPKGTALKSMVVHAYEPLQAVPGAAPTPVKGGQLYEQDTAGVKGSFTIGSACPAAAPAAPAPVTPPASQAPVQADAPLPVKVLTKSAKRSKSLTLKLQSSEPVTQLAAQLKKGKKVVGKGSLAKLDGKGTLKLKAKGLKKGGYVLDLAGTDGKGARRFVSVKLKLK